MTQETALDLTADEIEHLIEMYANRLSTLVSMDTVEERREWGAARLTRIQELLDHCNTLQEKGLLWSDLYERSS